MTILELRGRRIFITLATAIVLLKVGGLAMTFAQDFARINWLKSVVLPVAMISAMVLLWWGDKSIRNLVAGGCLLNGLFSLLAPCYIAYRLALVTPPEQTGFLLRTIGLVLGIVILIGLFDLACGLALFFLPSLQAFFAHQRGESRSWIEIG